MTTISLTAGDWDVYGNIFFTGSASLNTVFGWISLSSATIPDTSLIHGGAYITSQSGFSITPQRISIATTTTVYIIGYVGITSGTCVQCGYIAARRRR